MCILYVLLLLLLKVVSTEELVFRQHAAAHFPPTVPVPVCVQYLTAPLCVGAAVAAAVAIAVAAA